MNLFEVLRISGLDLRRYIKNFFLAPADIFLNRKEPIVQFWERELWGYYEVYKNPS